MIAGFDGLRAVAVCLVLLMHKTEWGTAGQIGYAGVWLFFLLSGYLIGGQLFAARRLIETDASSVRAELGIFWLKRTMRIFPAYYALILLLVVICAASNRDIPGLPWYLGYLSNFYFQFNPSEFLTTWAHFWSLAVEEQFYLFFGPLILLTPLRYATMICVTAVAISLLQRAFLASANVMPYVIYIDAIVNFGLLATGALLSLHRKKALAWVRASGIDRGAVGWLCLASAIMLVPLSQHPSLHNVWVTQALFLIVMAMMAALVMHVVARPQSKMVRLLEFPPLVYIGQISYGIYLYNDYVKVDLPERILRLATTQLSSESQFREGAEWLLASGSWNAIALQIAGLCLCFALVIALAEMSYRAIEKPAMRQRDRWLKRIPRSTERSPVVSGMTEVRSV